MAGLGDLVVNLRANSRPFTKGLNRGMSSVI